MSQFFRFRRGLLFSLCIACNDRAPVEVGHGHGEEPEPAHGDHGDHGAHEKAQSGLGTPEVIRLSDHVIESNGILSETVTKHLLLGVLEIPAEIQANPDRTAHVTSLVSGQLLHVDVGLGDRVQKGQTLATIRSIELGEARAAVEIARARKQASAARLQRAQRLSDANIAAKKSLLESQAHDAVAKADLDAAKASLRVYGVRGGRGPDMALRSPLAGIVIERHASPGEAVDTSGARFVIADLDPLWVIGRVYEQELSRVEKGGAAEVAFVAYPGETWKGTVDYVADTLDEETRTLAVRVVLANQDGRLKPGMFGTIALGSVGTEASARVLAIPDTALQTVHERTLVFVEAEGSFQGRDVVPGERAHGLVEIRQGLKEGDRVVIHGSFVLKSEMLKSSIGEGHAH